MQVEALQCSIKCLNVNLAVVINESIFHGKKGNTAIECPGIEISEAELLCNLLCK